jgi:hypothetical protein
MYPVCGHGPNALIGWDLIDQLWQHRRVTDIARGDCDGANFQCFLVDANV